MKCTACGVEVPAGAAFCQSCGAKVGGAPSTAASDPNLRGGRKDDPEEELWTGGYSSKAMMGTFVGTLVISIGLIVAGVMLGPPGWMVALGAMVLMWVYVLAVLMVRRMNITYRLTSQRFFHTTGILTKTTNRIEVIHMDDVTFTQTFFQRFFGVGTIRITSSDPTDPVLIMPGIAEVKEVSEIIDKARRKEVTRRGLRIESV
jgi:uncharacterized membrane protein YdbT with pleckstrin-like domain